MHADLDLLLIYVFCAADDFLPARADNARRMVSDAEIVTLSVAQAIMGIPSDPRFLTVAPRRLGHLFPKLPGRAGYYKRRERLSDQIEALIDTFASRSPLCVDDLVLIDSTPIECARSRETVKRGGASGLADAISDAADYGYCASHSRYFWGFRLHGIFALDGTPRALRLSSPKIGEREVALGMFARLRRAGPITALGDKGYAGSEFEADAAEMEVAIVRPRRKDEPGRGPHLAPIRQRVESIFWTAKDILTLERHGARTLHGLRTRLVSRFVALAAAIALNHQLGLPPRALAQYVG